MWRRLLGVFPSAGGRGARQRTSPGGSQSRARLTTDVAMRRARGRVHPCALIVSGALRAEPPFGHVSAPEHGSGRAHLRRSRVPCGRARTDSEGKFHTNRCVFDFQMLSFTHGAHRAPSPAPATTPVRARPLCAPFPPHAAAQHPNAFSAKCIERHRRPATRFFSLAPQHFHPARGAGASSVDVPWRSVSAGKTPAKSRFCLRRCRAAQHQSEWNHGGWHKDRGHTGRFARLGRSGRLPVDFRPGALQCRCRHDAAGHAETPRRGA